jgi:mono/diheme cytochrome c family protein
MPYISFTADALRLMGRLILFEFMCCTALSGIPISADEGQPGDPANGKRIFERHCAGCHGTYGQGDGYRLLGPQPADFTSPAARQRTDGELLKTIHEGKPNMPAWEFRLSRQDSGDVLAYIRKLAEGPSPQRP